MSVLPLAFTVPSARNTLRAISLLEYPPASNHQDVGLALAQATGGAEISADGVARAHPVDELAAARAPLCTFRMPSRRSSGAASLSRILRAGFHGLEHHLAVVEGGQQDERRPVTVRGVHATLAVPVSLGMRTSGPITSTTRWSRAGRPAFRARPRPRRRCRCPGCAAPGLRPSRTGAGDRPPGQYVVGMGQACSGSWTSRARPPCVAREVIQARRRACARPLACRGDRESFALAAARPCRRRARRDGWRSPSRAGSTQTFSGLGMTYGIGQRLLHHAQQRLRLRDALATRASSRMSRMDARWRRRRGRDELPAAPRGCPCRRAGGSARPRRRDVRQQLRSQLRGPAYDIRCAARLALQRREVELERGGFVPPPRRAARARARPLVVSSRSLRAASAWPADVRIGLARLRGDFLRAARVPGREGGEQLEREVRQHDRRTPSMCLHAGGDEIEAALRAMPTHHQRARTRHQHAAIRHEHDEEGWARNRRRAQNTLVSRASAPSTANNTAQVSADRARVFVALP